VNKLKLDQTRVPESIPPFTLAEALAALGCRSQHFRRMAHVFEPAYRSRHLRCFGQTNMIRVDFDVTIAAGNPKIRLLTTGVDLK
jgi:hypothetical protein